MDWAEELGLTGWVYKHLDGLVYLMAEGGREMLDRFPEIVLEGSSPRVRFQGRSRVVCAERRISGSPRVVEVWD